MLDISSKGLGVVAAIAMPAGTAGAVRFPVPGPDGRSVWFEAQASVVDCVLSGAAQGFRLGLHFSGALSSNVQTAIQTYVES
jgi:hypothetical protein